MDKAEFDKFADEYTYMLKSSIGITGEDPDYFAEYKIADIALSSASTPRVQESVKVLDFGSGNGASIPYVKKYFPTAELNCLDVSERSLKIAESRFPALANYVPFDGQNIPFPDDYFDISFAACVFHHIDHSEHAALIKELYRITRPGGNLFIFEHNPYNPLTVRAVNTCPFDVNAKLLKPGYTKRLLRDAGFEGTRIRYRVFFPHQLRKLRVMEKQLTWLPLGGQYFAMGNK